ncbi:MAG: hypothetical protein PUD20_00985 [bacterium]|nr:hypothetical protein [bacterium]
MEEFHYGFILYCYTKDDRPGYIGASVSSEENIPGDVKFRPSQLTQQELKIDPSKYYYMVCYTLKKGTNWVDKIEVKEKFDKKKCRGLFYVNETGEVRFENRQSARRATPEPETMDLSEFPFQHVLEYLDIENLNKRVKRLTNGKQTIEILHPKERILERVDEGDWRIGIVDFYDNRRPVTYIRTHHENRNYMACEKSDVFYLFSNTDDKLNADWVGSVYTTKNVFIVCYQITGEKIEDPSTNRFFPKASNVHFVEKIPSKAIVKLAVDQHGVRIELPVDESINHSVGEVEPDVDEEINDFLNRYVTAHSEGGGITELNDGLKMIETYKDRITEEQFLNVRYRILKSLYPITLAKKCRVAIIETIDALLSEKYNKKGSFELALYLEKANKLLQGKQFKEAKEAYFEWLECYDTFCALNEGKKAGLQMSRKWVQQGLRICNGGDEETEREVVEGDDANNRSERTEIEDYLFELLERRDLRGIGKDAERYQNDLTELSREDVVKLSNILEQQEKEENKDLWTLAKIYANLPSAPFSVMDESIINERANRYLEQALFSDAIHMMRKKNATRLPIQFRCAQILTLRVDESRMAATVGACALTEKQFEAAWNGTMSFLDVLNEISRVGGHFQAAKCMAILGNYNERAKKWLQQYFAKESVQKEEAVLALSEEWKKFAPGDDCEGKSVVDVLEEAMRGYDCFYQAFKQVKGSLDISSEAEKFHNFVSDKANKIWLDDEVAYKNQLSACLHDLEDIGDTSGYVLVSPTLLKATEKLKELREEILAAPTLISWLIYWSKLNEFIKTLMLKYRTLCKTSKPVLKVENSATVEKSKENGREVILTVTVSIGANKEQNAKNVTLVVDDESDDYECLNKEYFIADNLPSDGRQVAVKIPLTLKKPDAETISVRVRIECEYIGDVEIRAQHTRLSRNRSYSAREVQTKASYPSKRNWYVLTISVADQKEKPRISKKRINQFAEDGNIVSPRKGIDPSLAKILKNRDDQINTVMEALTIEETDEQGETVEIVNDLGHWILIYGQWRVGKSVILNCIQERLKSISNAFVVKISLQGSSEEDFEGRIARLIHDAINNKIRRMPDYRAAFTRAKEELNLLQGDNKALRLDDLKNLILAFMDDVHEEDPDVVMVLLVDEFTEIYQAIIKGNAQEGLLASWTCLMNEMHVPCVTAGGEHTVSLMETYAPNTFQKTTEHVYVDYLTKDNVDEYVRYIFYESPDDTVNPDESYFSSTAKGALDRIYELTQGNAFLMKLFCSKLIDYINENKCPYLNKDVVEATLDDIVDRENPDSVEKIYFNSLYNPFGETEGTETDQESDSFTRRIDDDKVRADNLSILHMIINLANQRTHMCTYDELKHAIKNEKLIGGDAIFEKRMKTLVDRNIIIVDTNENVRIRIDLYYELMRRIDKNARLREM